MAISFVLEGKFHTTTELLSIPQEELPEWLYEVQNFVQKWVNNDAFFEQQTSGSTGTPKTIRLTKKQMEASAQATIKALNIPQKASALLCINPAYIGGKMMIVRAMLGEWNLELVAPTSNPVNDCSLKHYDFAAFVPLQMKQLATSKSGLAFLHRIDCAIIGGAPVDSSLLQQLQQSSCICYSTYGMTETVSHVALKQLNGAEKSDFFNVIGNNEVKCDERDCLRVRGSVTNNEWIQTNDVIEVVQGGFKWIGRSDFVVNSGGVKIQIEETEQTLNKLLGLTTSDELMLWKAPDQTLGEVLIAIVNSKTLMTKVMDMEQTLKEKLPKYHFPRRWYISKNFYKTDSGKLDRKKTYESINAE